MNIESMQRVYDAPGRYYHTWGHIEDCFDKLEAIKDQRHLTMDEYSTLRDALKWHDFVYDAKRDDNEMQSALEFAFRYSPYANNSTWTRGKEVVRLIMLTKTHIVDPTDYTGSIMVSIDLSSLGASPEQFAINRQNIRKEFAHATDEQFLLGTMTFYDKMLQRKVIFPYAPYRERYEDIARLNMANGYAACRHALATAEESSWY